MKVLHARAGVITAQKRKLNARKSLAKGDPIAAIDALQSIKDKKRKEADDNLRKAKTAITRTENKARNILRERGIQGREERARLLLIQRH